jgi:hypothetical protein
MANSTDVRDVIAHQPTIGQSISALLRAIANAASRALDHDDPAPLRDIADSMGKEPKSWSDAVLANTSLATESAAIDHEPVRMPGHVTGMFAKPMSPEERAAEDKRLADAEAEKQAAARAALAAGEETQAQRDRNQAAADVRAGQVGATAEHQAAVQAGRTDPNSPYYDSGATKIGGGAIHF